MTDWTIAMVQDRLELAADVMRQIPGVIPKGYARIWPEYEYSFADQVGQEPSMKRPRPSPREITQAEEALLWLRWLEVDDAKLLWLRAERTAWKQITWQFGLSRTAATRRWQYGLAVIVWRLNGRVPPLKRSRRFVIENANRLSRKIDKQLNFWVYTGTRDTFAPGRYKTGIVARDMGGTGRVRTVPIQQSNAENIKIDS